MQRYNQIIDVIREQKPKTVLEIGTHKAARPVEWYKAFKFDHYYGFDVFEGGDDDLDRKEMNGKGRCSEMNANRVLKDIPHTLYRGLTSDTLPEFKERFDFAFIDGGHSIETIQMDFNYIAPLLNPGGVLIFDDYYAPERRGFGCNRVVDGATHLVMPLSDNGVSLVMMVKALEQ